MTILADIWNSLAIEPNRTVAISPDRLLSLSVRLIAQRFATQARPDAFAEFPAA